MNRHEQPLLVQFIAQDESQTGKNTLFAGQKILSSEKKSEDILTNIKPIDYGLGILFLFFWW